MGKKSDLAFLNACLRAGVAPIVAEGHQEYRDSIPGRRDVTKNTPGNNLENKQNSGEQLPTGLADNV